MRHVRTRTHAPVAKEVFIFVAVTLTCLSLTVWLALSAPAEKGPGVYLAHGIFSALFAVPTGAAWRSLRRAVRGEDRRGR